MQLRDYQQKAYEQTMQCFESNQSVLAVMATGLGKTIFFSHVAKEFKKSGRILLIAHREELITQGAKHMGNIWESTPEMEMGSAWDSRGWGASDIVVSSSQTQIAGRGGGRMTDFNPDDFSLVIIDEAHHSTANSYVKMLDYYKQNKNIKILGVTATPDRTDEMALQQVFDAYSFDYGIKDGIDDGWLVPIQQQSVYVEDLDFSHVGKIGGDLNQKDLAIIMEQEEALHGIATPCVELCGDKKTLVFAASVAHAERLAEIINRHKPDSARFVCGVTPKDERREMFRDYAAGRFQYLLNVGVATEGFDEPGIQIVVMARPTSSRCLFTQMAGRGTRTVNGTVDGIDNAEDRKTAILNSIKPCLTIIDFVGNCGKHKLISSADILGGKYEDDVIELAKEMAQEDSKDGPVDVMGELEAAEAEIEKRNRELAEKAKRKVVKAHVAYKLAKINPFDVFDVAPVSLRSWDKRTPMTPRQRETLEKFKVKNLTCVCKRQASQMIDMLIKRIQEDKCSYGQAATLARNKRSTNCTFQEASKIIDEIATRQGWGNKRR